MIWTGTVILCNSCGEAEYRSSSDRRGTLLLAKSAGWITRTSRYGGAEHICPKCQELDAQEESARLAQRWEPAGEDSDPDHFSDEHYTDDRWHAMKRD